MTDEMDEDGTRLETEAASERYRGIATWPRAEMLAALVDGQARALAAVSHALPEIESALLAAIPRIEAGGRLVYVGAGTSGRLAMLDAAELFPTFGWPAERAFALLAGGPASVGQAQEGAEDEETAGQAVVTDAGLDIDDVLIAIAASGRTPFTLAAAREAKRRGALVVAMANNPGTPLLAAADHPILLRTGAEVVAGSTRLAAGTAQKIALNAFSTGLMIALGRVEDGRMVSMRPSNAKLRERARIMLVEMTGCDAAKAQAALETCEYDIVAAMRSVGPAHSGDR